MTWSDVGEIECQVMIEIAERESLFWKIKRQTLQIIAQKCNHKSDRVWRCTKHSAVLNFKKQSDYTQENGF